MSKQIRIGVVGIGHLGNYHLQKYQKLENVKIVGVADVDRSKADKAAAAFGCTVFSDHRELVEHVDAVSVTVPTRCHHAVARDFLAAGKDVLMEKPFTATLEEADDLLALAAEKDLVLQVGFIERFNPAIVALDKVIRQPLFIESHRLHPFVERGTDVDVVLDLMIHDLDLILHYVRSPIRSVEAVGVSVLSEKVDIANVRLTFENGCVANITASRVTLKHMQKLRFFGLEGYHSIDFSKREVVSLARREKRGGKMEIGLNDVRVRQHDPLEEEIRAFVDCVVRRTEPRVSGLEARKSLELALLINEKMKTGRDLRL
ncbi:MAG TPA: Gfo/Idh/MocA family oxidoreductase [Syntrophales bacterium]|jgi:predicted dehydrogenase|nr:Gfo/Idh/MocA family oxidoreductase [Syntrophales bacterium]HQC24469.1 Gfo/Idh/MocA family oxidoreductase [Syntrophales bacterium]